MTERQIKSQTVSIGASLNPGSLTITAGDIVVWVNNTSQAQTVSSVDAGQTFTTGAIQPGAKSLPITVPASTAYNVAPAMLSGNITVNN
jgi:plastocyanin